MDRNKNVFVDIAADGIESAVITSTELDAAAYRDNVRSYISTYLSQTPVGTMLFNVCYKRSVIPSDVFDTMLYNVAQDGTKTVIPLCQSFPLLLRYHRMLERGIDIFEMSVEETHRYGADAWFTFRMNDHHCSGDRSFNSSFSYDNAERLGIDGSKCYMNWANKEVRDYYERYILETCERYDLDGVLLDFLRSCPIMKPADASIMNEFMRTMRGEINAIAERKGRPIKLGVRIHPTEARNLEFGIDAAQWIADGSIDVLAAANFHIPNYYDMPLDEWRESIDKKNVEGNEYTLLGGTDFGVRCDERGGIGRTMWLTLEQLRGFASAMYARGADGIYLFNHFSLASDEGSYTYYLENGRYVVKNVLREKLTAIASKECAEDGLRVYVKTDADHGPRSYPIVLKGGECRSIDIFGGDLPTDGTYSVVVGVDGKTLRVSLNGRLLTSSIMKPADGFTWNNETSRMPIARHVSETAPVVLCCDVPLCDARDGYNTVTLENIGKEDLSITWLEIQVCNKNINTNKE